MEIRQQNFNSAPQFQARHIANCGDLKLYKITDKSDMKFLKTLPENINTKNLMPNLSKDEYTRWNEMIEYAVDNAQHPENTTYIETFEDKICGIITFFEDKITELDCICTWPAYAGEKVQLAGQTLFNQMFRDFQAISGKKIKLEAITNGPFNTVKKYEKLGFKQTSDVYPTKIKMETSAPKVKEKLKELSEIIPYEKGTGENVDLFEIVDYPM